MAEYKQYTFSDSGTEITFMENFINTLLSLDDSFSLENEAGDTITVASEFEDRTSAKTATFFINLGNGTRFKLQRNGSNNQRGKFYTASFSGGGYSTTARLDFDTTSWGLDIDTQYVRPLFIAYLKSDTMLILWLGGCGIQSLSASPMVLSKICDGSNYYTGWTNSANMMSSTFINGNVSCTYVNMLPYAQQAGHIDYTESTSFVSGGAKQFICTDILSCSTIPQWSNISLPNGKNYMAVAANAMVEVDPEE